MKTSSIVRKRQEPLMQEYLKQPTKAWVTDVAFVEGKNLDKPFQTEVCINEELQESFGIGVHRALGGLHDMPNPGDMLCATLASCFESTLRMIADRLGIKLKYTYVKVEAQVDVRGTLMMDKNVPVAFQSMDLYLKVDIENMQNKLPLLLKATENCCVIFQTLKPALPIRIKHELEMEETVEL
ncbi:OsmC family protein [Gramella lutea]|uniref:OsmC family protein n=1 Tax=Christiangramia lutea TaxID=1607951 RepID=A0A9X1V2Y6_9FLAO|nr:OsmC family protein [Christiangramia lutea]MCH4823218.1 OsmC family protein [Christiangramia lutea]